MENVSTVLVFVTKIIQRVIVRFQFIKGQPLLGAFAIKSCSYHVSCGVKDLGSESRQKITSLTDFYSFFNLDFDTG